MIPSRPFLVALTSAMILAGVWLRFYHLNTKLYSFDETVTSIRESGHSMAQFRSFVHDGRVHSLSDLLIFQHFDPDVDEKTAIASLAREEPQHPPLYFILMRVLSSIGFVTIGLQRLPAAMFGTAAIAAMGWLAFELFGGALPALVAAALFAVSPIALAYSQQNREYSLWALLIAVTSALLLRALRRPSIVRWSLYAAAAAASLWVFTLTFGVLAGYAIYAVARVRRSRTLLLAFFAATGIALAAFAPWLLTIASNASRVHATTAWDDARLPAAVFAAKWAFNASTVFADVEFADVRLAPLVLLAGAIVAVAALQARRLERDGRRFCLTVGGSFALLLLVYDLAGGTSHSTEARYLTPTWMCLILLVAGGVARSCEGPARRGGWVAAVTTLMLIELGSDVVSAQAGYWWLASDGKMLPSIARALPARAHDGQIRYVGDDFYVLQLADIVHQPVFFQLLTADALRRTRLHRGSLLIAKPGDLAGVIAPHALGGIDRVALAPVFPEPQGALPSLRSSAARSRGSRSGEIALWQVVK